jgi:hypothetical protein
MTTEAKSVSSFLRILDILRDLSVQVDPSAAAKKYPAFASFAGHIAKLFSEDRLFDVLPRLEIELGLVQKYRPPARPAMDPYVSTQIGVFSRNFSDLEVGSFLGYPECCIRPFAEEARYGLDERHNEELKKLRGSGKIFVTTAGFVPHSIFCEDSHKRGLIAFVTENELKRMRLLEGELSVALPHMHTEYQGQYYEVRIT